MPAAQPKYGKVSVGGVSISGLTREEATRRLRRELAPRLDKRVGLSAGPRIAYRRRRDLGFSLDVGKMLARAEEKRAFVPVAFRVDRPQIARAMKRLAPVLSTAPREARPVYLGGRVQIRPEIVGRRFIPSTSAARVKIQAEKDPAKTRFVLETRQVLPRLTRARLGGINAVLSSFPTRFNPAQIKRTRNMAVAMRSIDGTLLSPGETFSLNKVVGPRTQARGYRTATIFEDGKKVPGIGGGVSQVTGTLFNAALVAGLPIVSYRVHSRPVAYLPLGRDATVVWNGFDMKFKNDTSGPIFISYKFQKGSRITATLFGKRTGKKAALRVVSQRVGEREIEAILFRTIRQNGIVVKKERVGRSRYNWKEDNPD